MVYTNFLYMFLTVGITITVILSPLINVMLSSYDSELQYHAANFSIEIMEQLPLVLAVVFLLVFVNQIVVTHRFCGPLINFSNSFKRISSGDLTRKIILRPNDFLNEEGGHINEMIDGLSRSIAALKEDSQRLVSAIDEVSGKAAGETEQKKSEEALEKVKMEARAIAEHLAKFKLPGEDDTWVE